MEQVYLSLRRKLLEEGHRKEGRTDTGTLSLFGCQMRFDLQKGLPLLTMKRVPLELIKGELLWFLKRDTNIHYSLQNKNHIWDEWVFERYVRSLDYNGSGMIDSGHRCLIDPELNEEYKKQSEPFCEKILTDDPFAETYGDLGYIYDYQQRHWGTKDGSFIDQIKQVIEAIKKTPDSRKLIASAWNPKGIPSMTLPPRHTMFQFCIQEGRLGCQLYQRSGGMFLGVPFNIISYALLTCLIAHETGLAVGEFVHTLRDAHLHISHIEQMKEQLGREIHAFPTLVLNQEKQSAFDFGMEGIRLEGYNPHPVIKTPIAVQSQKG